MNQEFNKTIGEILQRLPNVTVKRDSAVTILKKIEFEIDQEERYPFTKNLYEDLSGLLLEKGILIEKIEHLQYRERYTFSRQQEKAILDFEYTSSGFWGRVVPLLKHNNSINLLADVKAVLLTLKQDQYAG